jgi:hypothetical protein
LLGCDVQPNDSVGEPSAFRQKVAVVFALGDPAKSEF